MERKWKISANHLLPMAILTLLLPVMVVGAEPSWGPLEPWISYKDTPSGLHVVKDPLVVASLLPAPAPGPPPVTPTPVPTISGWVIYVCSDDVPPARAPEGLDYSVTAKGLSLGTSYRVRAYPQRGSADYGLVPYYDLGIFVANGEGEAEISGFLVLTVGPFNYQITVETLDGTIVLTTLPPFTCWNPYLDPPYLPFPLGSYLWFFGDTAEGYVVG